MVHTSSISMAIPAGQRQDEVDLRPRPACICGSQEGSKPHLAGAKQREGRRRTADAVHGDGDRLVRLAADGAQRHAAGAEARHDGLCWLHLIDADGRRVTDQLQAVPQHVRRAVAEVLRVRLKGVLRRDTRGHSGCCSAEPSSMLTELGIGTAEQLLAKATCDRL